MKIYFSAAIAQKHKFGEAHEQIVKSLEELGHKVFQDTTVVSLSDAINKSDEERVAYYRQVLDWISQSDVVVLEVSFPSTLHIGHEVSLALEKGRPVVALYQTGYEPSFFLGLQHSKVFWEEYHPRYLKRILEQALEDAALSRETRYNFFISPEHLQHLTVRARKENIRRAVYLRQLIEADMKLNPPREETE